MARKGRLQDGRAGTYCWTQGGEEIASVHWQVEDADYLHLLYTETRGDGKRIDHSDWLWLDHRPIILPLLHHIGGHYPLEANPIRSD